MIAQVQLHKNPDNSHSHLTFSAKMHRTQLTLTRTSGDVGTLRRAMIVPFLLSLNIFFKGIFPVFFPRLFVAFLLCCASWVSCTELHSRLVKM